MENDLNLLDIADDLLIINKATIDNLFKCENCAECIALYVFYYKTAKWQKTNVIKASDKYTQQALSWGEDKLRNTKRTLKEKGLIDIIQKRENNVIAGWYIEVKYIVSERKIEDAKIVVARTPESKNLQNQELAKARTRKQGTNALINNNNMLKENINVLKKEQVYFENSELNDLFVEFLDMRKKLKAVNSERGITLLLNELNKYPDAEKIEMIKTSIMNSWKSVYPLKKNNNTTTSKLKINSYSNEELVSMFEDLDEVKL